MKANLLLMKKTILWLVDSEQCEVIVMKLDQTLNKSKIRLVKDI